MANTFTAIHVHLVFSTKSRERWITPDIENEVWSYLGGICNSHGIKPLHIGGVEDHVHLLVGLPPTVALSDFMKRLKGESSKWIPGHWPTMKSFSGQDGYGAFSVGESQIPDTVRDITHQRQHHARTPFAEEYRKFVAMHDLPVDERYLLG